MIGKLIIDFDEVDLGELLERLCSNNIQCCVDEDAIYVYYKSNSRHHISKLIDMNKRKIRNYFFKELTSPPTKTPTNYVQTWLLEKFQEQEMAKFNEQHQAELKKAQENIKKAQEEFLKIITEYNQTNQGGAADGK